MAQHASQSVPEQEQLIQELNATETDHSHLIEGVNKLTNQAFVRTKELLLQKYKGMNPANPEPKTLYYPASGADVCFPFLLFPTLKTVYAFALEEFGEVSDINKDIFESSLMSLLPIKLDILFLKGAHRLLQEDQTFLSLCVNPFNRQREVSFNPMVIGSPQATWYGKVNHEEQQRYMFKDLRDILTFETSVSEDNRFAFGYNDCVYIGSCKQLRTDIFFSYSYWL
jgi:hypothetical protein